MHDISRHAIHTSEILAATIGTMMELQRYQTDIYKSLPDGLDKDYKEQAMAYTDFQLQLLKNLKLRSESNQRRLKNEVNLVLNHPHAVQNEWHIIWHASLPVQVFNNLAHQDNKVVKSIALLTMVFLPATFFSVRINALIISGASLTRSQALFSTTFFTFDNGWGASNRLWIYWVITIPATILVLIFWNIWMAYSRIRNFLGVKSRDTSYPQP
jgi:hypothetical protein